MEKTDTIDTIKIQQLTADLNSLMKDFRTKLDNIIIQFYEAGYDRALHKMVELFEQDGLLKPGQINL